MKRIIIFCSLIIIILGIVAYFKFSDLTTATPSPTDGKQEEAEWLDKERWFNEMHYASPHTNWRLIDQSTRFDKLQKRRSAPLGDNIMISDKLQGYWREVGSNNLAGRIHLSDYDSDAETLYLASAGGNVWRSNNMGANWEVLNDNFRIPDIIQLRVLNVNNAKRLVVASEAWNVGGFYYSDDSGQSWTLSSGLQNLKKWGRVRRAIIADDAANTIYLLAREWDYTNSKEIVAIYRSLDKGENFSPITQYPIADYGNAYNYDIWTPRYGTGEVFLAQGSRLLRLNQNDFALIATIPVKTSGKIHLTGQVLNDKITIYAAVRTTVGSDIYGADDEGLTWTYRGTVKQFPFAANSFCGSTKDSKTLYLGCIDCFRSWDGGQTWTKVNKWENYYGAEEDSLHADIPGINSFFDGTNEFVVLGTDGGAYISNDKLKTVKNISLNTLRVSQYYSTYTSVLSNTVLHAGSQDQGYQRTSADPSSNVVDLQQVLAGDYGQIATGNGGRSLWITYPSFISFYSDAANSNDETRWNYVGKGYYWLPPLMQNPAMDESIFLAGGGENGGSHIIQLSYNQGDITYNELTTDFSKGGTQQISALTYSPIKPSTFYVLTSKGEFYVSENSGDSWQLTDGFKGPDPHSFYGADILASPTKYGRVYVAGSGYSNPPIYVSEDNGLNFTPFNTGLPNTLVHGIASTPDEKFLFAATDVGAYIYVSDENMWYDLTADEAPDQIYWSVEYVEPLHIARFGTYGRGIWDFVIQKITSINRDEKIVDAVSVFPNPSSGNFTLQINSEKLNNSTLRIFDQIGKLVLNKKLNNADLHAHYQIQLNQAGIYMLYLSDNKGKIINTKQVIVAK